MARTKSSKTMAEQMKALQAEMKKAERAEYEEFGRWVVKQLSTDTRASATERIEEARSLIEGSATEVDEDRSEVVPSSEDAESDEQSYRAVID